jgi:hypothetical protein
VTSIVPLLAPSASSAFASATSTSSLPALSMTSGTPTKRPAPMICTVRRPKSSTPVTL